MESFWRKTAVQLGKQWKLVGLIAVAITALLAVVGLSKVEFATGQDSYLNNDSQVALDNVAFQDQFGGESLIMVWTADADHDITDLFTGDNKVELDRITAELEAIDETYAVVTPKITLDWSDSLIKGAGQDALLSAASRDEDADGAAARSDDVQIALKRRSAAGEQDVSNPDWIEFLIFGNDGFSIVDGDLVAPADEDRVVRLSLQGVFPYQNEVDRQKVVVGGVVLAGNATLDELSLGTDKILAVVESADFDGFELINTGSPVYLKEINDYLKTGMVRLGLAAMVVMAVILALMFRVRWRLLPLVSVIFGVAWSFSLLGLFGIDLSLVTISGLPILIGLGIDFAIQIHNRVEEEVVLDRSKHYIGETLSNVSPALIVATVGAILAFLALRISQVPMIRDFGVMLALGVGALVITGVVLPASILGIREYTRKTETRKESLVEKIVVKLGSVPTKAAPFLIVSAIIIFVVGAAIEPNVKIESDPIRWIDQSSQTVTDIDTLAERTGFGSTLGILVEANNVLDPELNEMLWDFVLDAEQRPEVVSSSSLINSMGKIITIPGSSVLTPTSSELQEAVDTMPPAVRNALINNDQTAANINLRLAPASLEERAELVAALEVDLQERIAGLQLSDDSVLLANMSDGGTPVRAVPSGLAVVGVGLLENLSANRAILTYLGLVIVGLWLLLRYRSLSRALLAMVPVALAVGVSSTIVGAFSLTLSPLTTVGGPLVIASCTEFSVIILARYLEERQRGLSPRDATDTAAARTGRAFFTSAATTIGGFAVLIGSSLPLLRDFGIIVTMNVAVALLAALVVLPPLLVWADERGYLGADTATDVGAVRLASTDKKQFMMASVGVVAALIAGVALYASAAKENGVADAQAFTATALPTPVPTPTAVPTPVPEVVPEEPPLIDVSQFGTEPPAGLIGPILFGFLTEAGADAQSSVCTIETMLERTSEADLLAGGIATFSDEAVAPVVEAAQDCGLDDLTISNAIAVARGEEQVAAVEEEVVGIDVSQFGTEPPAGLIGPILFGFLTEAGADAQSSVCTIETMLERTSEADLLAGGIATFSDEAVAPVVEAAQDCGLDQETIDGALSIARGE